MTGIDDESTIWVVYSQEHDQSGKPKFLAAFDYESKAQALMRILRAAGTYECIDIEEVPLNPL